MSMDIAKKQLQKLDDFIQDLQKELLTLAQYTDVGPSRALYAHIRELIKELMDEKDPAAFSQKFQGVNEAVAGILIILVPSAAPQVQKNMAKAHGTDFDPSQLQDLVNNMNQNNAAAQAPKRQPNPNADEEDFIQEDGEPVENKAEDVIDMLELGKHVKPKAKPGAGDSLGGVFDKYKASEQ